MKRAVFCLSVFLVILFPLFAQKSPDFDVIIKGGTVYDGTGAEPRRADLAIRSDRIAGVGDFKSAFVVHGVAD
jgi:N-acyl-D-amino-acid deacylase